MAFLVVRPTLTEADLIASPQELNSGGKEKARRPASPAAGTIVQLTAWTAAGCGPTASNNSLAPSPTPTM